MNTYKRHRFPPDIISYAVWIYYRFNLSHRDIEDLLAERGITVSREAIRLWCIKFGAIYARRLKRKHRGYGDTFYIDEVFVKINGKQHYLWVSRAQKHFAMSHFESCLHGLSTLKLHISSKNKLTCQYRQSRVARSLHNKNNYALIFSKSHAVI
jgi:hypothetical protein